LVWVREPGWPDEFVKKITRNVAYQIFFQLNARLLPWSKVAQKNCAISAIFKNNALRNQSVTGHFGYRCSWCNCKLKNRGIYSRYLQMCICKAPYLGETWRICELTRPRPQCPLSSTMHGENFLQRKQPDLIFLWKERQGDQIGLIFA
jgi:hypothetical protein